MKIKPEDFPKFTPVMQQYLNARYGLSGKTVLFFRMGDFYETFFEDAEIAARELEITLTGRPESNYPGGRLPMAGVPAKTIEPYVAKLIEKGYKVCIAEQMADPSTCKGLVPREITKIFTPGTINELDLLPSYQNNFILAIYSNKRTLKSTNNTDNADTKKFVGDMAKDESHFGLAYADISTGEFYLTEVSASQINQELARVKPSEVLLPSARQAIQEGEIEAREAPIFNTKNLNLDNAFITHFDKSNFKFEQAKEALSKKFNVQSLKSFGIDENEEKLSIQAAGAILAYLEETQKTVAASTNFESLKPYSSKSYMMLDAHTRRNLELVESASPSLSKSAAHDGSVLWAIDRTSSNLGKRRLRAWVQQPLFNLKDIETRQNSVTELIEESLIREEASEKLKKVYDIERLANRLASGSINPRELLMLKDSLSIVLEVSGLLSHCKSAFPQAIQSIPEGVMDLIREVEAAIAEAPPIAITEGKIIKDGYHTELDEYLSLVRDSQSWMKNYEEEERSKNNIKNLKVSFNRVHGYFIEVSKSNLKLVPEHYQARQTMVNSSRFITPELKEFEEKLTNAESRRNALEHKLYTDLRTKLKESSIDILLLASKVADLDVICSLAKIADEQNYSKPSLVKTSKEENRVLEIKDGRHPVIEQKLKLGEFVPNNVSLGSTGEEDKNIVILTGPNMAGKSTFMRQAALIILLAQIGSYVPASEAKISLVDRIFTRVGASDDLSSGQSTFMVEMNETAAILNNMTSDSFIILDEVGRGTSTFDGVSIAWAVIEYIAKSAQARTIFATHYHELADLESLFSNIINYQMQVTENKGSIEFLHKVAKGSADKSYGIEVAKLAGLPKWVLSRAKTINQQLQSKENKLVQKRRINDSIKNAINKDGEIDINKLPLFDLAN